jgi:hypothetical protein
MSSNSLSVRLPTADLQLPEDADGGDDETAFPRESMNKLILNYFVTGRWLLVITIYALSVA